MKILVMAVLALVFFTGVSHGVTTRYINDFRFDNLDNVDASNVSFIENGGIELSKTCRVFLSSPDILWDVENWKNGLLCSSGDTATLIFASERTNYPVFASTNHVLFSDILNWNGQIWLTALPRAEVFVLDETYRPVKHIRLSNEYLWQMLPVQDGLALLAGNPAAVYRMERDGEISLLASVPTEDNLIKGLTVGNTLYFIGDGGTLYRLVLNGKKRSRPVALASFDNPVGDILYHKGKIYLITAPKDGSRPLSQSSPGGDNESSRSASQDKRSSRNSGGRSMVFMCDTDGTTSEIFSRPNIRFLSLSVLGDSLIVGADRNAGYFEIPLAPAGKRKFTGLGKGKFARLISSGDDLYGVLLDPSRIVKIGGTFSPKGYFISSPFDTGNNSRWGNADPSVDLLPGTGIKTFGRSGAVQNEDAWDDWSSLKDIAVFPQNRFFQYRIELSSDGKNTPVFRNITIPYVQDNLAPRINKINISMNNPGVYKISWDASDENKDVLIYNFFLAKKENEWIPVNDRPLEESSLDLQTSAIPDGKYRLKIAASDERSNPPAQAKTTFSVSDPILIDNTPPVMSELKTETSGKDRIIRLTASDELSDLFDASYSVNGGKWIKFLPINGLFDSKNASFELKLREDSPFTVQIRISDLFGNASVKGCYFGK